MTTSDRSHASSRWRAAGVPYLPGIVVVGSLLAPGAAVAQETRQEAIALAQAEKARDLKPYEPHPVEQAVGRAGEQFANPPIGFYPWFGSIYPGGLLAAGPGYRQPLGDTGS